MGLSLPLSGVRSPLQKNVSSCALGESRNQILSFSQSQTAEGSAGLYWRTTDAWLYIYWLKTVFQPVGECSSANLLKLFLLVQLAEAPFLLSHCLEHMFDWSGSKSVQSKAQFMTTWRPYAIMSITYICICADGSIFLVNVESPTLTVGTW